ncbi:MAG TPA: hypothetical protein DCZ03_10725, partial [Gammaproteobacteria bacterium]|nr:hypothetical protein [Gammaproteobacteria bacterium]
DYVKAKKYLHRVLEIKPNFIEVYYRLGIIAFYEKDLLVARQHFERVVAAHPKHNKAQYNLAIVNLALAEQHLNFYTAMVDEGEDISNILTMLDKIREFSGRGQTTGEHQDLDKLAKMLPAGTPVGALNSGEEEYRWIDGRTYIGSVQDGKKQGYGTMIWPNGAIYEGDYLMDKKHGEGIFQWPDKHRYVGEFKDDKMHGRGIYSTPDGFKFVGQFENDLFHGLGQCSFGDTVIDCQFDAGKPIRKN